MNDFLLLLRVKKNGNKNFLEELVKKQQEEISELNTTLGFINEVEPEKEEKTEKHVHQDSATDSVTKKFCKLQKKYQQNLKHLDIYWSSIANEFNYYDNFVMKEDMDEFLGDERVTNTVIDAHNYILRDQENNLDHKNFYFSVNLFVSYKY
ncbi:unnamed protein product [Malus baccata var. baccata]